MILRFPSMSVAGREIGLTVAESIMREPAARWKSSAGGFTNPGRTELLAVIGPGSGVAKLHQLTVMTVYPAGDPTGPSTMSVPAGLKRKIEL
jgi:hypothetical protein